MMVSLPQEDFIDQCSVCFTCFQGVSGWDSCGSMGGLGNALADDSELRWNCMMFTTSSVDIRTRATKKEKSMVPEVDARDGPQYWHVHVLSPFG